MYGNHNTSTVIKIHLYINIISIIFAIIKNQVLYAHTKLNHYLDDVAELFRKMILREYDKVGLINSS